MYEINYIYVASTVQDFFLSNNVKFLWAHFCPRISHGLARNDEQGSWQLCEVVEEETALAWMSHVWPLTNTSVNLSVHLLL